MTFRTFLADRRLHIAAGVLAALIVIGLVVLAMMPWGAFKPSMERGLSDRFGRPVTIGAIDRVDSFSFTPTVEIHTLRIPQAEWAGTGDLARIDRVRVRFSAFQLLFGRFRPGTIDIDGAHLVLVRDADRRENWRKPGDEKGGGGGPLTLKGLRIANSMIVYRDAFQKRSFAMKISADPATGVTLNGNGTVLGEPVTIVAHGPAIEEQAGKAWPFQANIDGAALTMRVKGVADAPLDLAHMTIDVTARADDLKFVDAIIEAGLFGTQPVQLAAHVRRDGKAWKVSTITGRIGSSDIAGHIDVDKVDGRTKLKGEIVSNSLNFDDFASRAGAAAAAVKRQQIGPRLVPDTRINIGKITHTDGTIAFTARHLVGHGNSALAALQGTLTIDHQLLTISPFTLKLTRGTISGSIRVDQHDGRAVPLVTIDLALRDSGIAALAGGGGEVDGRVDGRVKLTGTGSTIREAVGASNGTIGLVARDGTLPAKVASQLGFDVVHGLFGSGDTPAGLRCVVLRLAVNKGVGTADPFVIDTTASQAIGHGTITFPSEAIGLSLTGTPKGDVIIKLPGAILVNGTIREPHVGVTPGVKSAGNIFKAIGRAIRGDNGPRATDADCEGLAKRALG
ncbi:MAG: AsmA family protein [Sphingomonas sp.]